MGLGVSTPKAPSANNDNKVEEMKESEEMSKAFEAVAGVRKEVDKLSERVAALEVVVNSGTKVANEEFDVSAELLMRELLKLDGIEAEGEAKLQRKAEVRRVQNFHDTLDKLKTRNSNPFIDKHNAVKVATNWETFDSGMGSLTAPPPTSSSTNVTRDWERFDD
ncbi:BAG family molecular chaperone regulator 4 [Hibiscus syriacus]|uniref:BAG family molecular chaperone regulator 4 n=2 Tax=Hibiscus syriacus TaxID=106335 RepID=A0A6A2ZNV2_HIBSY|nr:BAG family molecular chaperone regulator 4-like isoform X1 [Hibiscus syriacus]KAE8692802.1 BAG family molecular chaperone regulator 4 [Hibiscus syriacus]